MQLNANSPRFLIGVLVLAGMSFLYTLTASLPSKSGTISSFSSIAPHSQLAQVADVTSGLVGWWKFDETSGTTAADSSGSNHSASLGSSVAWSSTAKIGGAVAFNGSTDNVADSVDTGQPVSAFMSNSAGTITAWIYLNTTQAGSCGNGSSNNVVVDSNYGGMWLGADASGNLCAGGYDSANRVVTAPYATNQWIHVAWVHDNGTLYLYKNGVAVGSTPLGVLADTTHTIKFGVPWASGSSLNGYLDDVRIYNRALSATEIANVYAAAGGTSGTGGTTNPPPTTSAPVISGISVSSISSTSATVSWTTDQPADGTLLFGPTTSYSGNSGLNTNLLMSHSAVATQLLPNTVYHYAVVSKNSSGQSTQSPDATFTTAAGTVVTNPPPSGGTTVAQDGSGTYTTISACIAAAQPGSTCTVSSGTYHETIQPTVSGTYTSPINVIAATGATVNVDAINLDNANFIWLQGLRAQSITQYGITWTFDTYYPVGLFANGDYWVQGPVVITAMTPAWNGAHNGWEVNPLPEVTQPYDVGVSNPVEFSAAGVPALPYTAQPGSSIVKGYSYVQDPTNTSQCYSGPNTTCLLTAAVLTVVSTPPPDMGKTVFRPPYVGTNKPYYSVNQLQTSLLPSLAPVSSAPTLDTTYASMRRVQLDHFKGDTERTTRPKMNLADYSPAMATVLGNALLRLTLNDPLSAKMPTLIGAVQGGIDRYYMSVNGQDWPGGGGYELGEKMSMVFAADMLGDQTMKNYISSGVKIGDEGTLFKNLSAVNGTPLFGDKSQWDTIANYWGYLTQDPGYNLDYADLYNFIDGGMNVTRVAMGYQVGIISPVTKEEMIAMLLIPGMKTIWNDPNFFNYTDRFVNVGLQTEPDMCAPPVGICVGGTNPGAKCTTQTETLATVSNGIAVSGNTACGGGGTCSYTDPATYSANYGVTYGPDSAHPGMCILDPNLAPGATPTNPTCQAGKLCGRFPQRQGIFKDYNFTSVYGSPFSSDMWTAYRSLSGTTSTTGSAPVISAVTTSGISTTSATVSWTTDQAADSKVLYGTTASYTLSTTLNSTMVTSHTAVISSLLPNTTYHYAVVSKNSAGQSTQSPDATFTTQANTQITVSNAYYVDYQGGSDTNSGTSPSSPWQHAPGDGNATGNAATAKLQPGSTVIFKGGVTYYGSVYIPAGGTAGSPVTYDGNSQGTFGSGRAIMDGALSSQLAWTQCASASDCGGNPNYSHIYYAPAPATFTDFKQGMFENGQFMYFSQDPILSDPFYWDVAKTWHVVPMNSTTITETNSSITDPTVFTQSDPNYWVGAYLTLWVNPNDYTIEQITGYDPTTHTVTFPTLVAPNTIYPSNQYDNYYSIINSIHTLNAPGRYYLDQVNHRVYIWPTNSGSPAGNNYSFGTLSVGIRDDGYSYVTVRGFQLQHYILGIASANAAATNVTVDNNVLQNFISNDWYAIQVVGSNALVTNNTVQNAMRAVGILVGGTGNTNIVVKNNFITRATRQGIWCMGGDHTEIVGNYLTDENGQHANGISVYSACNDSLIANNVITNTVLPITFEGSNNLTLFGNVIDGNNTTAGVHDWGNMTGTVVAANNTIVRGDPTLSGGIISMPSTDTATFIVYNNIFDGGGAGSGVHDYTIYNRLGWWQDSRYGWNLGAHESIQSDLSTIFINPSSEDFHLLGTSSGAGGGVNALSYLPVSQFSDFNFLSDVEGHTRSATGAWDLGAYVYGPTYSGAIQMPTASGPGTPPPPPPPTTDTTPPVVSLISPTNGATVSGSAISISVNATDNVAVSTVQLKIDGTNMTNGLLTTPTLGSTYSGTWNTTGVTNGTHTLTAVATDSSGNTSTSAGISVNVSNASPTQTPPPVTGDTTPPSAPTNLQVSGVTANQINLTWSASTDNVQVYGYDIYRNGATTPIATVTGTGYSDTNLTSNTSYSYAVKARDTSNNSSQAVMISTSTLPATYSITVTTTGTGSGTITCGGVACPTIVNQGTSVTFTEAPNTGSTFGSWSGICAGTTGSTCTVVVNANITVSASFTAIVNQAPTVTLTSPSNGSSFKLGSAITLSATASDPNSGGSITKVEFYASSTLVATDTVAPYSNSWTPTIAGTYTIVAKAYDNTGLTNSTNPISVSVVARQNKPPKVGNPHATAGSVILSWDAVTYPYATHVAIYRSTTSFPDNSGTPLATVSTNSYEDKAVNPGTTYYYALYTVDDQNNYSDPTDISFTTPSPASYGGNGGFSGGGGGGGGVFTPAVPQKPVVQTTPCVSPIPTSALNFTIGTRSSGVTGLQTFLSIKGFLQQKYITGYYGALTQTALNSYLKQHPLPPSCVSATNLPNIQVPRNNNQTNSNIQSSNFSRTLTVGSRGEDVRQLQIYLNNHGFLVASSGNGSKGHESTYFGPATMRAVALFQRAYGITPAYGNFGTITRTKVNQLLNR